MNIFQRKLENDIERIKSAQVIARALVEGSNMGKGTSLADRIKAAKEKHTKECDEIAATLDEAEKLAPQAYAAGRSEANNLKSDVDGMLGELRQLSNLPLAKKA